MIIGMVGLIGSGKDTAADFLVENYKFTRDSFANTLKDAVSSIFGWDRELVEGKTVDARKWREETDLWWSERLGMNITPRSVLQLWGTEVCRVGFHNDIWIASLENRLRQNTNNVVISDVRFPNEIAAIKNAGGYVIRIKRGPDPSWFKIAELANRGHTAAQEKLVELGIHSSESSWIGEPVDGILINDSSIEHLFANIRDLVGSLHPAN